MPLIKREVAPVHVSQIDIAPEIKDELECVSNYTLANIIRQLGNLGRHAEDIFGDLLQEATGMGRRAKDLQTRLEKIKNCVDKMDPLTDAVSLRDINTRMAFKSSLNLDSEVVSSPTMPSAMKDIYLTCAKPPPLSQLNTFRDDGKDGLKMYTDPKFFFERWCNEQSKDIDKKKRRKKKRPQSEANTKRPKKVVTRKDKYKNQAMGQEFMDISDKGQANGAADETQTGGDGGKKADHPPPASPKKLTAKRQAPTLPPAPPPPSAAPGGRNSAGGQDDMPLPPPPELGEDEYSSINYGTMGPPPPLPQPANGQPLPPPPPPPMGSGSGPGAPPAPPPPPSAGPAPPPPPPVPGIGTVRPPAPPAGNSQPSAATTPARSSNVPQVPITNTQDDLLSAIRQGMQLRKVVVKEKERVSEPEANSVEAILKRRIAVELSSDEETITSSDSEWEEDD